MLNLCRAWLYWRRSCDRHPLTWVGSEFWTLSLSPVSLQKLKFHKNQKMPPRHKAASVLRLHLGPFSEHRLTSCQLKEAFKKIYKCFIQHWQLFSAGGFVGQVGDTWLTKMQERDAPHSIGERIWTQTRNCLPPRTLNHFIVQFPKHITSNIRVVMALLHSIWIRLEYGCCL